MRCSIGPVTPCNTLQHSTPPRCGAATKTPRARDALFHRPTHAEHSLRAKPAALRCSVLYCAAACCTVLCRSDGDAPNIGFLHALGGFTYLYTCQDVAFPINHSLRNNTTRRFAAVAGAPFVALCTYWHILRVVHCTSQRARAARSMQLIACNLQVQHATWHVCAIYA